jgi:glycerate kinase
MKVVIAMDSFKGSLTATEACGCIERGVMKAVPQAEIIKVPMADGGEGTVQSLVEATGGVLCNERVTGPNGKPVNAFFGILGDGRTAVIEMAAASGLPLVQKDNRNPMVTTTYGTGELIRKALDRGCREILIGIGGSATNDGGAGMAQALGIKLLDKAGDDIGNGGGALKHLKVIDISGSDPRLKKTGIAVLCDVDNPLCGEKGAAFVYGPQKGATPEMVVELDNGLRHFSKVIKEQLGKDIIDIKGAGAAGGMGGGLIAFLGAELKSGIEMVIDKSGLWEKMAGAAYVITGEGKIDYQTSCGKTPVGVAKATKQSGAVVIALAGSIGEGAEAVHHYGIDALFSIIPYPVSLEEAMDRDKAGLFMEQTAEQLFRLIHHKHLKQAEDQE